MSDKTRYTFRVDEKLWKQFQEICVLNDYQKNLVIENLIKKFINETGKKSNSVIMISKGSDL